MQANEIELGLRQKITVGRQGGNYDSIEIFVGGNASLEEGEPISTAFVELSTALRAHLKAEIELAAAKPMEAVQTLINQKEAKMAPPPQQIVQQQSTKKPVLGHCGNCGDEVVRQDTIDFAKKAGTKPRCWKCWKKGLAALPA